MKPNRGHEICRHCSRLHGSCEGHYRWNSKTKSHDWYCDGPTALMVAPSAHVDRDLMSNPLHIHGRYQAYRCRDCGSYPDPDAPKGYCQVSGKLRLAGARICTEGRLRRAQREETQMANPTLNPWTDEEDRIIRENGYLGAEGVAKLLPNRTLSSIKNRAVKQGYSLRKRPQQAVPEPEPQDPPRPGEAGSCETCRWEETAMAEEPCHTCAGPDGPESAWEPKPCDECAHEYVSMNDQPCDTCSGYQDHPLWKPKPEPVSHCTDLKECLNDLAHTPCGADPCNLAKMAEGYVDPDVQAANEEVTTGDPEVWQPYSSASFLRQLLGHMKTEGPDEEGTYTHTFTFDPQPSSLERELLDTTLRLIGATIAAEPMPIETKASLTPLVDRCRQLAQGL